jgi:hypothetical protein
MSAVFTPDVRNAVTGTLTVIGVGVSLFVGAGADWTWKVAWSAIAVLLGMAFLFGFAAYRFYYQFSVKLRVLRQTEDVSSSDPSDYIIVFENPEFIREGSIVSLVSPLSGAAQQVALLRVIRAQHSEPLQAKPYPKGFVVKDLGSMIGSTKLYVSPMVHSDFLERNISELKRASSASEYFLAFPSESVVEPQE